MTMERPMIHVPVMLSEVLSVLDIQPGELVVDGTLGLAGHAGEMLKRAQPGGMLIATDWDAQLLSEAALRLPKEGVELHRANFRDLPEILAGRQPNAILLDLGLNSAHLEDPERGISFQQNGPLDMRMDRSSGEPASSLLNRLSEDQLERILSEYGGEKWSRRIAKLIIERRKIRSLKTTQDLVECVLAAIPASMRDKRIHPATRTFQAFRIAVSGELDGLKESLIEIAQTLAPGGRMAVLCYHDGEDRPTKQAFRALESQGFENIFDKPSQPTAEEVDRNRRSRSAKLRAILRNPGEKQL